jgi:RNA polymerase primary sigma factor
MRQLKITQQITNRETMALGKYFSEINSIKMISLDEEKELSKRSVKGDQEAINKLVEANLRFVISVAKHYQNTGEILDDLISAGNVGLIEAAKRFDESKGFKFISYAVWWIRQSIMQHLGENNKTIRLPLNKIGTINKIRTVQSSLEQVYQRPPTAEEISIGINEKYELYISASSISDLISKSYNVSSLDAPLMEEGESGTLNDVVAGEDYDDINNEIKRSDLKIKINTALKRLSPNERKVVTLFFGLDGTERSLAEIGETLDLTRERVRQIKESAVRKMKAPSHKKALIEYL